MRCHKHSTHFNSVLVKAKEGASKEDQEFARSEKRQQITGELEVGGQSK